MFDAIAHRYDLLNRVLSFGRDAGWRRRAVELAALGAGERALDVGAGTGDLALALAQAAPSGRVVALDLAPSMLARARARAALGPALGAVVGSAEALPFADGTFVCVVAGFAVRNFGDVERGLAEMRRVVRAGGRAVVLELSRPPHPALRALHFFYLKRVAPLIATVLGSSAEAYRYLPRSIEAFPDPDTVAALFRHAGFTRVRYERLTFGVAAIHVGEA